MKIFIGYPPLNTDKGIPLLSQNRQFQYFKKPTYIYPVVPAAAATLLKNAGYEVIWKDCIAEGWSLDTFYAFIKEQKPDIIAFETKTPVVNEHWKIINELKRRTRDVLHKALADARQSSVAGEGGGGGGLFWGPAAALPRGGLSACTGDV